MPNNSTPSMESLGNPMTNESIVNKIFEYLDPMTALNVGSVSRLWQRESNRSFKLFLINFFPDLFEKYKDPAYQEILQLINSTIDWKNKFKEVLHDRCQFRDYTPRPPTNEPCFLQGLSDQRMRRSFTYHHISFTASEVGDYVILRSCDVEGIKKILASDDGHRRIFLRDKYGDTVFDFVRKASQEKRQLILDNIFKALSKFCKTPEGEWDTTPYPTERFMEQFGIHLPILIPHCGDSGRTVVLAGVFALLCNQLSLVNQWINQPQFLMATYAAAIAIRFNLEDIFQILLINEIAFSNRMTAPLRFVENSGNWSLQAVLKGLTYNNYHHRFATSIAQAIAKHILSEMRGSGQLDGDGRSVSSSLMSTFMFLMLDLSQLSSSDQLSGLSVVGDPINFLFINRQHIVPHRNRNDMLRFLIEKGVTFANSFDSDTDTNVTYTYNEHPLAAVILDGDLVTLHKICKDNPNDVSLKTYALYSAAYYGEVECFKLMLHHLKLLGSRYILRIDRVHLKDVLENGQIDENRRTSILKSVDSAMKQAASSPQPYPARLSLFGVRRDQATGPKVAEALRQMQKDATHSYEVAETAWQFLGWAKKHNRKFNSNAIDDIKQMTDPSGTRPMR